MAGPFDFPQLDGGYEISVKGKNCALDWESKQQCLNRVFQIAFFSECKESHSGTLGKAEGLVQQCGLEEHRGRNSKPLAKATDMLLSQIALSIQHI